ncbi:MAG: hypothetical protein O7J95_16550, partial [Planctomycetota bacterium]|nr:hypothetical protein [Planctomycetota bacterium]
GDAVWPGEGNLNHEPLFVGEGDYHLQPLSAAIDDGTSEGAPKRDIEGNERPCWNGIDMGAYEYCGEVPPLPPAPRFLRGDCNDDGNLTISDAVCTLSWLFRGEAEPNCLAATNADGVGAVNITDPIYLLTHLFLGGPPPVAPFPDCGAGPTADPLGCETPPKNCPQ